VKPQINRIATGWVLKAHLESGTVSYCRSTFPAILNCLRALRYSAGGAA
jgi:hypothetical protein